MKKRFYRELVNALRDISGIKLILISKKGNFVVFVDNVFSDDADKIVKRYFECVDNVCYYPKHYHELEIREWGVYS